MAEKTLKRGRAEKTVGCPCNRGQLKGGNRESHHVSTGFFKKIREPFQERSTDNSLALLQSNPRQCKTFLDHDLGFNGEALMA